MSRPPLIGLPGRRTKGNQLTDLPAILGEHDLDVYLADNGRGVIEAGGIPVHIPLDVDIEALAVHLDGVVLTGGTDVDPARYGASPHADLQAPEPERDELELTLFAQALERKIPVLGICRGLQLINVHQGGTLHQHVEPHRRFDVPSHTPVHNVSFVPSSILRSLYGANREVNSLHHQTVAEVGTALTVTARADDGTVEGLEMGDSVVAVQWHPEMMQDRPNDAAFAWLVNAAASCRTPAQKDDS